MVVLKQRYNGKFIVWKVVEAENLTRNFLGENKCHPRYKRNKIVAKTINISKGEGIANYCYGSYIWKIKY